MVSAVVLVGLAPLDPEKRAEFAELVRCRPNASLAFLALAEPPLTRELNRLADQGIEQIQLVVIGGAAARSGRSWVRRVAAHWLREQGGPQVAIVPGLLDGPDGDQLDALLATASSPVTGKEAALVSPAWDEVPGHRHQVFVCKGPRCHARGADDVESALYGELAAAGLGDDDVLVTATGCQFPCNHAPLISIQPDDIWYGDLDAEAVGDLVVEHLSRSAPLPDGRAAARRLPRRRGPMPASPDGATVAP